MSGILDSKNRIMDTMLTAEGLRQLSTGDDIKIKYYSFTDVGTYYKADIASGSADATRRIYLEACSLPQDQITFESNDSGRLQPFPNDSDIIIKNGQIVRTVQDVDITGSKYETQILSGSELSNQYNDLLSGSINNFDKLSLLSTLDPLFDDNDFGMSTEMVEFKIRKDFPIENKTPSTNINSLDYIFFDPRLSNSLNYKYMPPINKVKDDNVDKTRYLETVEYILGDYVPSNNVESLTYQEISKELEYYESRGACKEITFDPSSRNNDLTIQVFEKGQQNINKLDIIEYGKLQTGDPDNPIAHIFFVGKLYLNDDNINAFAHIFTLVFN